MSPPGIGARKIQEGSRKRFGITYQASTVALEGAVMDLNIGTALSTNRPALKVPCDPPGIGAKISDNSFVRTCSDGAEK
jgi:hypothetical protein